MKHKKIIIWLLLASALVANSSFAAFCSLRDPVVAITSLFGTSVTYRSYVESVTEEHRQQVQNQIPFRLHRSEIGQHTLFMVFDGMRPVGFVQARSELTEWGLMEIAWAIELDMTIKDFFFQRCRSPICKSPDIEDLKSTLIGKSVSELAALLDKDGNLIYTAGSYPEQLAPLAQLIVQSAMKTLTLSQIAWSEDLNSFSNSFDNK